MNDKSRYWFPAKSYGWGWGLPTRWQGWIVLCGYTAGIVAGVKVFEPRLHPIGFVLCTTLLSVALVVICWLTGEPPRWRWGK